MLRWLIALLVAGPASGADKTVEFFWKPYAHAAEVASLELKVNDAAGQVVKTASIPPGNVTLQLALADGALYQAALTAVSVAGEPRSESAATTVDLRTQPPPPPTKLPAPEGFGWRLVDQAPPPPPGGQTAFMQNIVLRDATGYRLQVGQTKVFAADPKFNVYNKSWGVSLKYQAEAPPTLWAVASLWNAGNPQWMLKSTGETRVGATLGKTNAAYDGFDIPGVDSVVGRFVHVVLGYDAQTKTLKIWIDGVLKQTKTLDANTGWADGNTPDLVLNSNEAGHAQGDLSIGELVYAVGAFPTQADVDALGGQIAQAPRFETRMVGETIEIAAYGPGFADRNHATPQAWVDGQSVTLNKVRDNRPIELRYQAVVPANIGAGTVPLKAEWRWNNKPAPDAVVEATGTFNRVYTPKPASTPAPGVGVSHIRRSGAVSQELQEDSEIYVGAYGFGAGEFNDDRWGLKVRDEMLGANFGVEGGSILHYQKQPEGWPRWVEMTEQMRIANGTALKRWPGPWSVPDDDFLGPDALAALMAEPGWEGYSQAWCDWRNTVTTQKPRFVLYKDEVNLAFDGDPESTTQPLLAKLVPFGGIGKVVDTLRTQSKCPVAPGMFGVNNDVPIGYSAWMTPKYSDFIAQYHQPNNLPAPWSGQTLRQATETLRWAAKHRDPARPLSLNFGLIVDYFVRDAQGQWYKQIAATDPKSIPGQIWVNMTLGATVMRGYALASYDARQPSDNPAVPEYQQAVKPGEPAYYAMLSAAKAIKDYTRLLLGAEQPVPDAGPDFLCGHRLGPAGRVWWAINLSEVERTVPASAIPAFAWKEAERLHADGQREAGNVIDAAKVPPNGVLIATLTP